MLHTHTQTQTQTQTRHDTSSTSCRTYFSKLQDFLYKCRQILSNSGIHMQCEIVLSRFVTVGDLKLLNMYEYVVFLCASKFIGLHIIIKGKPHKVKEKMKDMVVQNLTTPVRTQKKCEVEKKCRPMFQRFSCLALEHQSKFGWVRLVVRVS